MYFKITDYMKPRKSKIHCPYCGKSKIQFATEQEANRFLKYNAAEILEENGLTPIRSYYCGACNCWHVTSQPYTDKHYLQDERHLQRNERYQEKTAKAAIRQNVKELKEMLHEINRFVTGHSGDEAEAKPYYQSLFQRAIMIYETITDCLTKRQFRNLEHRICIIRPLIAEI